MKTADGRSRRGAVPVSLAWMLFLLLAVVQDWYVDVNAPGCSTGTGTQMDPFCNIQDAVDAAADGDTVHIAPGTYFENVVIEKNLNLIGTEGQQVTIVDGNATGRVVEIVDSEVAIRGFTLRNGYALAGAGIRVSGTGPEDGLTLRNSTVTGNVVDDAYSRGGGIAAYLCTLTLVGTTVSFNLAGDYYYPEGGGGIFAWRTVLSLGDSVVRDNAAPFGGGICSVWGTAELLNSVVVENTTDFRGSAIWARRGHVTLTNSTVARNTCPFSGALYLVNFSDPLYTTADVRNSVLWENTGAEIESAPQPGAGILVQYSLVEGGWPGNLGTDPLFVNAPSGDFRLLSGSPCIDAGNNTFLPRRISTDIRGLPRFVDDPATPDTGISDFMPLMHLPSGNRPTRPVVDMGAYEFQ